MLNANNISSKLIASTDAYNIWDKTGLISIAGFIYLRFTWQPAKADGYAYPYASQEEREQCIYEALQFANETCSTNLFEGKDSTQLRNCLKELLSNKHIPRISTIESWADDPRGMAGVAFDHYVYWRIR